MFADPNPTELSKLLDPDRRVEDHRFLFCDRYMHCLDTAVASNWTSWSCTSCPLFTVAPRAPSAVDLDLGMHAG